MSTDLGTKAVIKIADSAGTLRDFSAYLNDSGFTQEVDMLESTTFGKTSKTRKAGLKDSSISLSGEWDPTADGYLNGILGVNDRNFEYYPQGIGVGLPKYTGLCLLAKYDTKDKVDALGEFSADIQGSDTVTRAIQ